MQERLAVDCEECLKGLFSLDSALRYDRCVVVRPFSCNHQVPGSYTISRVVDSEKDQVANSRIKYVPGKGFTVEDRKFFDTLTSLIHSLKNQLGLTHACGGSQYVELFKVEEEAEGGAPQSNHYYEINSLIDEQN
mgnify:FL=1